MDAGSSGACVRPHAGGDDCQPDPDVQGEAAVDQRQRPTACGARERRGGCGYHRRRRVGVCGD